MSTTHKQLYEASPLKDNFTAANTDIYLARLESDLVKKYFTSMDVPLLEGGCGAGRVAFALEEMGYSNITAFDFSRPLIDDARRLATERKSRAHFIEADACNLGELKDDAYQCVYYGRQLLSFIPMPGLMRALLEARRVLSPDGVFVFSVMNRGYSPLRRLLLKAVALRNLLFRENFSPIEMPFLRLGTVVNWSALFKDGPTVTWLRVAEAEQLAIAAGFKILHRTDTAGMDGGPIAPAIFIVCAK